MPDTPPAWWPQVLAEAGCRRHVTGQLLTHATPHLHGATLQLTFTDPHTAQEWQDSQAQAALDAALQQHGINAAVEVATSSTRAGLDEDIDYGPEQESALR